ncbi:MAG: phage major tail protein, TP901-1 family [Pseudomonadota bacterium]
MPAEKGSAFLLKISDDGTPPVLTTVAGMRTTQFTINAEAVDVTTKASNGWRTLLAGAGVRAVSITGAGVFTDGAAERLVQAKAMDASLGAYQVVFETGDSFAGSFQVTSLEYAGDFNGERTYSLQLESSGPVVFTDV